MDPTVSPRRFRWPTLLAAATLGLLTSGVDAALAQPGTSEAVVVLPLNGSCSVALAYDGTYAMTTLGDFCESTQIGIYSPPAGTGTASLVAVKNVVDRFGMPVVVSALDWDPTRNRLWGVSGSFAGMAWLIDLGIKTASGFAIATLAWEYSIDGIPLINGLAWDRQSDDLWISPDIDENVYRFDAKTGALEDMIQPKNAAGTPDGLVTGVAVGSQQTLYITRDGTGEIRRVNKDNGTFVSGFTTTNVQMADAVCADPRLYGVEAILVKDALSSTFEAFEVEPGTCPLVPETINEKFTGGGSIPSLYGKVTHGFVLYCDKSLGPNSLEVSWGGGNNFHLEVLDEAKCVDTPDIDPEQPGARFDTHTGKGRGRCNGLPATATWTFKDAGEPGRLMDTAAISITGGCTLVAGGKLEPGGNHQAHDPHPNQK